MPKTEIPKGVLMDDDVTGKPEQYEKDYEERKSYLESIMKKDKIHSDNFTQDKIVEEFQEKKRVSGDKFKYLRTRVFKNGTKKVDCVGVEKVIQGKSWLIYNWGIKPELILGVDNPEEYVLPQSIRERKEGRR